MLPGKAVFVTVLGGLAREHGSTMKGTKYNDDVVTLCRVTARGPVVRCLQVFATNIIRQSQSELACGTSEQLKHRFFRGIAAP